MNNKWMRIVVALAAALGLAVGMAACTSNSEPDGPGGQPPSSEAPAPTSAEPEPVVEEVTCETAEDVGWALPAWEGNACKFVDELLWLFEDAAVANDFSAGETTDIRLLGTADTDASCGVSGTDSWYSLWCPTSEGGYVAIIDQSVTDAMPDSYWAVVSSVLYDYSLALMEENGMEDEAGTHGCVAGLMVGALYYEGVVTTEEAWAIRDAYFADEPAYSGFTTAYQYDAC